MNTNSNKNVALRYAFEGLAAGFIFPVVATIIRLMQWHVPWTFDNIITIHSTEVLMVIINLSPVILFIAGYIIGMQADRLMKVAHKKVDDSYRKLIEQAGDVFYTTDKEGNFVFFNSKIKKNYGYNPEDLIGKHFLTIVHPEWKEKVGHFYQNQFETQTPETIFEFQIVCATGEKHWVEQAVVLNIGNDKMVSGFQSVVRDITARKEQEKLIFKLNEELQRNMEEVQNANKEMEAFVYSASHDLRAPLRRITTLIDYILADFAPLLPDEGKEYLGLMDQNAKRMTQLLDDLLKFSRMSKAEMKLSEIDMQKMTAEAIAEVKSFYPKVKVDISVDALPHASADESMITQVWINFISNAVKYSSKKENPTVNIGAEENGKEIIYFVKDNGTGFDMKYYDKLFGVFSRLHSQSDYEGTGIGLSLVKRIVERHKGRVWGEGVANEGATFYFALPKAN